MAEIKLKSEQSDEAVNILKDALKSEEMRLRYALEIAHRRISRFEDKYGTSSENFIEKWTAEDLPGGDDEYVEWAGEIKLASRVQERLNILNNIEYVH